MTTERRQLLPAALLAVAALCAPSALAAPVAEDGAVSLEGRLAALQVREAVEGAALLEVSAKAIRADWDYSDRFAVGVFYNETGSGSGSSRQAGDAFAATAFHRAYYMFVAPPSDGSEPAAARVVSDAMQVAASGRAAVSGGGSSERPAQEIDVRGAKCATGFGRQVEVTLTGSFRLVLWGVDGTLSTPGGDEALSSGTKETPVVPVEGTGLAARTMRNQVLFLEVTEGSAKLRLPGQNLDAAYLHPPGGELAPATRGAVSKVADGLAGPGGGLALAASAVAGAVAWRMGPPRLADARMRRLRSAFEAGRDEEALRRAPALASDPRHRWAAGTMRVVALLRLGHTQRAADELASLDALEEAPPAGLQYLSAMVAAARGDNEASRSLLANALGASEPSASPPPPPAPPRRAARGTPAEGYA